MKSKRIAMGMLLLVGQAGCIATQSLPSQAPVIEASESQTETDYLLYVPSTYKDSQAMPLVVACHGTIPYDTADLEMQEWANTGEREGIIVAAPRLKSSKGDFPPSPEKQIELQRQDEQSILAIVGEIKRKYSIAPDRVYLTGWSAASFPILQTGLNHPDIFRAIFIRQGSFDERFMDLSKNAMDRWQPIKIVYGHSDFLRDQTRASIRWLREQGMFVVEEEIAGIHRRIDPKNAWDFFESIASERPWIQIRSDNLSTEKELAVQFHLDAHPRANKQKWFFGDGTESYDAAPRHEYSEPGKYRVHVNVELAGGKIFTRSKEVRVVRVIGEPK